jgi:hypothetical protein
VAAGAVVLALNCFAVYVLVRSNQVGVAPDYQQYAGALERFVTGGPLYVAESKWRYSPVAILTLGPAIATGLIGWTILHVAVLALVRPIWLAATVAVSWPFLVDVVSGNTVTFVAVAAIFAVRGSAPATYAYWWLTLIMPRPFQLPLAVYLAWRRPDLRIGLAIMVAANLVLMALIGQGPEWVKYLMDRGTENLELGFNIHPIPELAWLLAGIPLALVLTWRRLPGLAGVVLFPALLAQYLLILFADVAARVPRPHQAVDG